MSRLCVKVKYYSNRVIRLNFMIGPGSWPHLVHPQRSCTDLFVVILVVVQLSISHFISHSALSTSWKNSKSAVVRSVHVFYTRSENWSQSLMTRAQSLWVGLRGDAPYPLGIDSLTWGVADLWLVTESTINCGDRVRSLLWVLHLYWAPCQMNLDVVVASVVSPLEQVCSLVKGLFWLTLSPVHKLASHLVTVF